MGDDPGPSAPAAPNALVCDVLLVVEGRAIVGDELLPVDPEDPEPPPPPAPEPLALESRAADGAEPAAERHVLKLPPVSPPELLELDGSR